MGIPKRNKEQGHSRKKPSDEKKDSDKQAMSKIKSTK